MKPADKVIIIILLAFLVWGGFVYYRMTTVEESHLEIYKGGELLGRYSLEEDREIRLEYSNQINIVRIENGTVKMVDANCPHQDCLKQLPIKFPETSIICLPHEIILKIVSDQEAEVDIIVR